MSVADLPEDGTDLVLSISEFSFEEMRNPRTGDDEEKPCLWFHGVEKALICNKTLSTTVANLYGDDCSSWAGKPVALYPTEVETGGKVWPVIRIRPKEPATAPDRGDVPF